MHAVYCSILTSQFKIYHWYASFTAHSTRNRIWFCQNVWVGGCFYSHLHYLGSPVQLLLYVHWMGASWFVLSGKMILMKQLNALLKVLHFADVSFKIAEGPFIKEWIYRFYEKNNKGTGCWGLVSLRVTAWFGDPDHWYDQFHCVWRMTHISQTKIPP